MDDQSVGHDLALTFVSDSKANRLDHYWPTASCLHKSRGYLKTGKSLHRFAGTWKDAENIETDLKDT